MGFFSDLGKSALQGIKDYGDDINRRKSSFEHVSDEKLVHYAVNNTKTGRDSVALKSVMRDRGLIDEDNHATDKGRTVYQNSHKK